jgi:hypothetical protein
MDRAKFGITDPGDDSETVTPKNPRRHFKKKGARAPGRSGKGKVHTARQSTRGSGHGRY